MNRPDDLATCLTSVFNGRSVPDEVIVSDDSPDPGPSREVADRFAVRYLEGPRQGLARNRSRCVDQLATDFVGFIDDDVILPAGYLAAVRARLRHLGDHTVLTGGEVRHGEGGAATLVQPHHTDFLGFQRRPASSPLKAIVINSTFFPRSLFASCRFDERLRYGSEEVDIARQAGRAGYRIEHDGGLLVDHHQSPINRASYARHVHASRLYASAKNYLYLEPDPLRAAAYAVVAPTHLLAASAKAERVAGARAAATSIRTATGYLLDYRRARRRRPT
jgi:GT2 family glycosyltransferase